MSAFHPTRLLGFGNVGFENKSPSVMASSRVAMMGSLMVKISQVPGLVLDWIKLLVLVCCQLWFAGGVVYVRFARNI